MYDFVYSNALLEHSGAYSPFLAKVPQKKVNMIMNENVILTACE